MNRNVEIKARLHDWNRTRARATELAGCEARVLVQEDVFYPSRRGRLKLRRLPDGPGELIFYERADATGPRTSHYVVHPTQDADSLHRTLRGALGERTTVRKERHLFLVGQTRIHLDRVEGLGDFLELEVVLRPEQDAAHGRRTAEDLMSDLGIAPDDLVARAYVDLLEARRG